MKKLFIVIVAILIAFVLTSCPDKQVPKAGDPVLKGIDFKSYDAFAVMKESSSSSKSLSDGISSSANRLFGLADSMLEKITLADEKGIEWACNEVKNIGNDFLLMGLSYAGEAETQFRNYCIDRMSGKVIDLSFLVGSRSVDMKEIWLQSTSEGLFAKKDATAVKIDLETKTLTPLTNPEADIVTGFYRFNNGNMFVRNQEWNFKLFPPNGIPIEYNDSTIRNVMSGAVHRNPSECLTSPELDFAVNLHDKKIIHIAQNGIITQEPLPKNKGGDLGYSARNCLYPQVGDIGCTKTVHYYHNVWYDDHGINGHIAIHDISTGELVYTQYLAPPDLTGTMGYDNGIFYYSTNDGIFALELETQVTTTVFEGSVSSWKMAPGGLIYTKYLSATDTQTCFYNFATKETEVLSSSGVEVVSIASFVD